MATEHVTRFYSLALGREKNFNATTAGLISAGDTTPDVSIYSLLWANTAGTLTISYFDSPVEGQLVMVGNVGTGKVAFSGAEMYSSTTDGLAQNGFASFIHHNSAWYELLRTSANTSSGITVAGSAYAGWSGTSTGNFSVSGVSLVTMGSAGKTIINGLSDGAVGQTVTIINKGAGAVHLIANSQGSVGQFCYGSMATLVVPLSSAVQATFDGTNWWIPGAPVATFV